MARVENLKTEEMTPEQQRIARDIASARSRLGGPFAIWLRTPAIADAANRLGNVLRRDSHLDKRLFELMVLVAARHWSASYAWTIHEKAGREAGLSEDVIAAIRDRRTPAFKRDDERLVHDVVIELNESKKLSNATYERALAFFGLALLIEFIAAAGFYTMVAMTLSSFDAPTPDGAQALPD
jgi:4-carboxymuconolactone decarboxylase